MFILFEIIIYIIIFFSNIDFFRWLSILLCFLYAFMNKRGYIVLGVVLLADIFMLFHINDTIGILLFLIVQCCYHYIITKRNLFYIFIIFLFSFHIYFIAIIYALVSFINLIISYHRKHWLFYTILLLGLCDICVAYQYLSHQSNLYIWLFYLPSQVYFVEKIKKN